MPDAPAPVAEAPPPGKKLSPWRTLVALGGTGRVLRVLVLAIAVGLSEGAGVLLLVPILDSLASAGAPSGTLSRLLPLGGLPLAALLALFVALVALRSGASGLRQYESARLIARIVDGLRSRALAALVHAEWRHLAAMSQAQNRALLISGVDRVWQVVERGLAVTALVLNIAALVAAAFVLSWRIALGAVLVGGGALLLYGRLRHSARRLGDQLSQAYRSIYAWLEQSLGGLRLYKSYGREQHALDTAVDAFAGMRRAEIAFVVQSAISRGAVQIGGAVLLAVLVWLAIDPWGASPLVVLPFVALCARALPQMQALQETMQSLAFARPALDEVIGLIADVEAHAEPAEPGRAAPRFERAIQLEGVGFAFAGGRTALHEIEIELPARTALALVGPSGAGKSTLADILGGLLAPDSGRMLVDGQALDAGSRRAWRGEVAYMQQEAVLFSGSIRDNLLWARPEASEAELRRALERAAARFAFALPGGLDCDLGEGARQLSGGERQRIALARALLRDPRLLILDEATSAVDAATEREVAEAIGQLRGALSIVIIGHRGLLTELADRRVELAGGRIVAGG